MLMELVVTGAALERQRLAVGCCLEVCLIETATPTARSLDCSRTLWIVRILRTAWGAVRELVLLKHPGLSD